MVRAEGSSINCNAGIEVTREYLLKLKKSTHRRETRTEENYDDDEELEEPSG